ncbi:hypothetical protein E2P81_ATG01725 [Venturia nashicola]|nr:hypothetical protein E2P81_ATG01725 [Venturia nashicola]
MYERPSDTELYIRGRVNEFKARSMVIDMSGVYPSPPASPPRPKEYEASSPDYGAPKPPSYVPYQGKPAYSPLSTSTIYVSPTPMSPAYIKAPSTVEAKHASEAHLFEDMMHEHDSGTSKAGVPIKPAPTVSDSSKEDARWSLMKDEEGMTLKDLATGLEYYTNGLCDQEQTIQETEIAQERRVKVMNDAASVLSYVDFCKKYDDVYRFQNKLRAQLCEYRGASKLLEANLVIRNEVGDSKLIWAAEEAIAEASKLMDGLLTAANEADDSMNTALDISETKHVWDESKGETLFEVVDDEMMVDTFSEAGKDVEQEDNDDLPWTEDEFAVELEHHIDALAAAEETEKVTVLVDNEVVDSDATFLTMVNTVDCPAGKSPYDCLSQADKERYDDMLLGLGGDDDYEDEEDSAESSLLKTDLNFETTGFTGFNAGLKPVPHAPKVSSPLAVQPVFTVEDECAPVELTSETSTFDFLLGGRPSIMMAFAAGGLLTAAFLEADDDFVQADEVLETSILEPLTSKRKRSSFGDDDVPTKKAKISHESSEVPETHLVDEAPEPVEIDFLPGDCSSGMMNFAAGGLLTAAFFEAGDDFVEAEELPEVSEVPEAPILEPLTINCKRSRFSDDGASMEFKRAKFTHVFPADLAPVLEPLTSDRKRSSSGDVFTPLKKAKFTHDDSVPEIEVDLSNIAPETQMSNEVPEIHIASPPQHDLQEVKLAFSPSDRRIKAMKSSRIGTSPSNMKRFQAGGFADALKDHSVVEPLSSSRKHSCSKDHVPRQHSSEDRLVKKAKLSASTTELVQTLVFNLASYGTDGQFSFPSNTATEAKVARKSGKQLAGSVGIWRDAISKTSSGVVMGKVGGKKDGLGGLREKYLAACGVAGGEIGGLVRKMVKV